MEAVVQKWGNDFGIKIPNMMARKMSLKTGYRVFIVPLEQKSSEAAPPRKGWAKAFQKAKKKEKMLIPQTIVNSGFEWEW